MSRALLCSLTALAMAAFLLLQPRPSWEGLGLVLGAISLALELLSIPQKRFGFFTSSFSCNLAMALLPSLGPGAAVRVLLLSIGLRTLLKGAIHEDREDWGARWREALADLNTQLVPMTFLAVHPGLDLANSVLACSLHWPLALLLSTWLAEELPDFVAQERREVIWLTGTLQLALGFLGVAMAQGFQIGRWEGFWLLPVLLVLQRSARTEAVRLDVLEAERLWNQEQIAQAHLAQTRQDLQSKIDELEFLEEFAARLARVETLELAGETILRHLGQLTGSPGLALWLVSEDKFRLLYHLGPACPVEPNAVLQCARSLQNLHLPEGTLYSLDGEGVVYVHKAAIEKEGKRFVPLLLRQALLGLQSARRHQAQRAQTEELAQWVNLLVFLLDGARALSGTLESPVLVERFSQLLEPLSASGQVILEPSGLARRWGTGQPSPSEDLSLELKDEGGRLGQLVLKAPGVPFNSKQKWVLQALCLHLAGALRAAEYHGQVSQTLLELRQTQAQLVQSSKMAAMGQFAAGVAHEINSPLAAIGVALDAATSRLEEGSPIVKRLELARKGVEKATAIIAKLLYYSREGSQGRQQVAVGKIIQDTMEIFGPQMEKAGLAIDLQTPVDPQVEVNLNEIQQVLVNLLLNARDATSDVTSPRVRLSVGQEGREALLEVSDNGPGVPEEVGQRIFEPFFTTKGIGQGTGLGLSVSYQIAENHRGQLLWKGGSTFQLRLPLAQEALAANPNPAA